MLLTVHDKLDLLFLPEWLRHFALTFAFRSNVDKLLGPGWWNFKRMHSILIIIFKSHQNVMWLNYYAIDCLHLTWSWRHVLFNMLMRKSHEQCALECFCRLVFLGNLEYPLVVLVVVITFIIMWPLHNQSYCNISMKNGSNVIITHYKIL
jgi:hypothetical protein